MNKIITLLAIILSGSIHSQKMLRFEVFQDLTSYTITPGYSLKEKSFGLYSTGLSFSYMLNPFGDRFYFEPTISATVISGESSLVSQNYKSALNPSQWYIEPDGSTLVDQYSLRASTTNSSYSFGFNLMKKVSNYFWIGGGIYGLVNKSIVRDNIVTDAFVYENDHYSLVSRFEFEGGSESTKITYSIPIIIRGSLPIGKNFMMLSAYGHISQFSKIQASVGFCF